MSDFQIRKLEPGEVWSDGSLVFFDEDHSVPDAELPTIESWATGGAIASVWTMETPGLHRLLAELLSR